MGEITKTAKAEKHIRNYATVRATINRHYKTEIKNAREQLIQIDKNNPSNKQMINHLELLLKLRKKNGRPVKGSLNYYWDKALARLEAADKAGKVTSIKIEAEWKHSRSWGNCPSVEAWIFYDGGLPTRHEINGLEFDTHNHHGHGYASGYGYDKLSTAINEAVSCSALYRLIIENKPAWKKYAVDAFNGFPRFSIGGKGVETLRDLFRDFNGIPGFNFEWNDGKSYDLIKITKRARRV